MSTVPTYNREKLAAAILYVIRSARPDRLGAVKLHKVLYYADMLAYLESGRPITGAAYRKRPFGPACDAVPGILEQLKRDNRIAIEVVNYHGFEKKQFTSLDSAKTNLLDGSETGLLDEMIDFVCNNNSARTISEFSHDLVWQMVEFGEVIPYHNAINLIPTLPTSDDLGWAEREIEHVEGAAAGSGKMEGIDPATFRSRVAELRRNRQV